MSGRTSPFRKSPLTRREWLAASAAVLGSACRHRKASGYPGYALVATSGENSVAVVDLNRFQLAKKIELNAAPSAVIATQSRSYALTPANGTVHLLDGDQLRKTGSIRLGDHIDSIRLTPDGRRLAGISGKSREMVVADVESGKQLHRFGLDYEPLDFDLQVHAESKAVYAAISGRTVGDGASGTAEFIDLTNRRRRRAELNGRLGDIRFRLDGALALLANYDQHSLMAIDTATGRVITEIALAMRPGTLFQFRPGATVRFGQRHGWHCDRVSIPHTGRGPNPMLRVMPRAQWFAPTLLRTCLLRAARVLKSASSTFDSRKVIAVVQAGQMPNHITITPDQQYALVLNEASGDMAVIRITTITANRRKSGSFAIFHGAGGRQADRHRYHFRLVLSGASRLRFNASRLALNNRVHSIAVEIRQECGQDADGRQKRANAINEIGA